MQLNSPSHPSISYSCLYRVIDNGRKTTKGSIAFPIQKIPINKLNTVYAKTSESLSIM